MYAEVLKMTNGIRMAMAGRAPLHSHGRVWPCVLSPALRFPVLLRHSPSRRASHGSPFGTAVAAPCGLGALGHGGPLWRPAAPRPGGGGWPHGSRQRGNTRRQRTEKHCIIALARTLSCCPKMVSDSGDCKDQFLTSDQRRRNVSGG